MAEKTKNRIKIKPLNNFAMLAAISVFEAVLAFSSASSLKEFSFLMIGVFALFIALQWAYTAIFYFAFHRRNFELEFIAFFLCSTGLCIIGSIEPKDALKQLIMIIAGILIFIMLVFLLGDTDLCMKLRLPVAVIAVLALAATLVLGKEINGAKNWIVLGPFTIQPSELVKAMFIFVGSATLEKIQTTKNLWAFMGFVVVCIGSLFVMRDFGTALIFFVGFLILAFMNSGDIRTVIYSVGAGLLGSALIIRFKPYVTARFSVYRHVWENYNESGYQQTRVLVGLASGGLLGLGIGAGNVRYLWASTTDLIFGVICEELGYIFGILTVLCFVGIAVSALINSVAAKSTFYSIAAVAGAGMLLFQTALNIFGITDVLPLTGVTLPFISQGGSSMMSCWAILAFIKASDVRTYNMNGGAKK